VAEISSYYLCDYCDNDVMDVWPETCHCRARGMEHVGKKVMHDCIEKPTDVCEYYEPRKDD
jgi:hypothetical protein